MRRLSLRIAIPIALGALAIFAQSASAAPAIDNPTATHVSTEAAHLGANISTEAKTTSYHFEYGLADCASNPCTATPVPDAKISGAIESANVSAELEGLTPGSTYHFRVVAKNSEGTAQTLDKTFRTASIPPHPEQSFGPCPNDAYRSEHPSAKLPDCRAYEQASPVDKNGLDAIGQVAWVKTSPDGDRVSFLTTNGLPGGQGAQELPTYLSSRGADNWSTQGLLPPATLGEEALVLGWSPDFSHVFDYATSFGVGLEATLVSRSSTDGSLATIVPYGQGLQNADFLATSDDGTKVFFESRSQLLPEAIAGKQNVYLWDSNTGELHLASALNDGKAPTPGAFAGAYDWLAGNTPSGLEGRPPATYTQDTHAITSDGSLYFTEAGSGRLYLRRNPAAEQSQMSAGKCTEADKACTVAVATSKRSTPDPAGTQPAAFMAATPDGSKAFFTSSEKLTDDANTGPEQPQPAIVRSDLEGKSIEADFIPAKAAGIAVDSEHVYWADPVTDSIGRATIEGDEVEDEWITGADNPRYVAVDSEHVYWTNAAKEERNSSQQVIHNGTIGRADIEGTQASVKQDFIVGANNPQGIAVNSEYVYWANAGRGASDEGTIGRAELDGEETDQEFIPGYFERQPQGLVIDASHIYWSGVDASDNASFILRADLDGLNRIFRFIDGKAAGGTDIQIRGVAVDAGHVYWASEAIGTIGRISAADFTEAFGGCETIPSCEKEFVKDQGKLKGLALDASHLYWSENGEPFPNPGNDLYRFDADSGNLTDVAPDSEDPNGAEVLGVIGASDDGSYVYFAANGDLDGPGGPASAGNCSNAGVSGATGEPHYSGACSLYLAHAGAIQFIARLDTQGNQDESDALTWLPRGGLSRQIEKTSRVSPDGRTLIFRSQQTLTAYDNDGVPELYRYRVGETGPTCVSCNPTGIAPTGIATRGVNDKILDPNRPASVLSRVLSSDGDRVFFESTDPLVIGDVNGDEGCPTIQSIFKGAPACQDVYEWEAKGTGSCEEDIQGGGCLYLLSSGKSTTPSFLVDASSDGEDAFFITRSQLVPQDQDQLYDIYDASAGGGLAAQSEVAPVPCEGEACKAGASTPPAIPSPGTPSFSGPPDPKPKHAHKHKRHRAKKPRHHKRHRAGGQRPGAM